LTYRALEVIKSVTEDHTTQQAFGYAIFADISITSINV